MKDCAVVFITHKSSLNGYDERSFMQCLKVFKDKRDIKLVIPNNISTEYFDKYADSFEYVKVNPEWLSTLFAYNKMCCTLEFWKLFESYNYVLIYQSDCWCFDDKLDYFIGLGYDWYGAAWPNMSNKVGNGGLSLRKVRKMIELTSKYSFSGSVHGYINEDVWYCITHGQDMDICPYKIATNFALEMLSNDILKSQDDIPMGLHGKFDWILNLWDEDGTALRELKKQRI